MICLDTNAVIALLNQKNSAVEMRLQNALKESQPVAISSAVLFELLYGAMKSAQRERNAERIGDFLAGPVSVLDFDPDDAREAANIRVELEREGTPIGPYDVLIAAQARRRDALLVTANASEFTRVPGLKIQNWAKPG